VLFGVVYGDPLLNAPLQGVALDGEYIHANNELLPTAAQARIVPRIPTRRQPPACTTGEFHNFREGDSRYSPHVVRGFSITDYTIEGLVKYLATWEMKTEFFYYAGGIGFFKAWHKREQWLGVSWRRRGVSARFHGGFQLNAGNVGSCTRKRVSH
jgi:hypothetical protein